MQESIEERIGSVAGKEKEANDPCATAALGRWQPHQEITLKAYLVAGKLVRYSTKPGVVHGGYAGD